MAKIWQKTCDLNRLMEIFTVGDDYILDLAIIPSDCVASLAHAAMLGSIGILKKDELGSLKKGLVDILKLHEKGDFPISKSDEDGHTAIENYLIKHYGDAGKKIHTGRSRNDQVIAALRLFSRDVLIHFRKDCHSLINSLISFADKHKEVPMPGRTHMQIAMPSSVGLWAGAFAEELLDDLKLIHTSYRLNNMCPLGSAASYGVPLPLNRELVSELLGFEKVQNNVLYVNNSRGKVESIILTGIDHAVLTLSKLAQDLILFSMPEFGYFSLPEELCSGSSIMPQKKNPDGLELLRAKSASISSAVFQINQIIRSLPSGYNRDFQETKGPYLRGIHTGIACVKIMDLTVQKLNINKEKLLKGFIPEIFAADAAFRLVKEGIPFRDAYRTVGMNPDSPGAYDPERVIMEKSYTGTTGNLCLEKAGDELDRENIWLETEMKRIDDKMKQLVGFVPDLAGSFLEGLEE